MSDERNILNEILQRITRVETKLDERSTDYSRVQHMLEEHNKRLRALEDKNIRIFSVKDVILWLVTLTIAIGGVMK